MDGDACSLMQNSTDSTEPHSASQNLVLGVSVKTDSNTDIQRLPLFHREPCLLLQNQTWLYRTLCDYAEI